MTSTQPKLSEMIPYLLLIFFVAPIESITKPESNILPKHAQTPLFYCLSKSVNSISPSDQYYQHLIRPPINSHTHETYFLQPLVKTLPLYISKSKHFIQLSIWLPLLPHNYN